ncbi:MAG: T9SS type A sorting domain-containing protein [Flavobacteriaceae bacterium]|nr:T9SS type A sorting domain-containing protein [Flavobacteriaceae bacterium]
MNARITLVTLFLCCTLQCFAQSFTQVWEHEEIVADKDVALLFSEVDSNDNTYYMSRYDENFTSIPADLVGRDSNGNELFRVDIFEIDPDFQGINIAIDEANDILYLLGGLNGSASLIIYRFQKSTGAVLDPFFINTSVSDPTLSRDAAVDTNGDLVVLSSINTATGTQYRLTRLALDGTVLWENTYSNPEDAIARGVVIHPTTGDIIMAGETFDIDLTANLRSVTSSGVLNWEILDIPQEAGANDIIINNNDHIIISGGALLGANQFVGEYDLSGNEIWTSQGDDPFNAIFSTVQLSSGEYITGGTSFDDQFDPTGELTLSVFQENGDFIGTYTEGNTNDDQAQILSVVILSNDDVVVTGLKKFTGSSNRIGFVARYSLNSLGVDEFGFDTSITIHPNPANDYITLTLEDSMSFANYSISNTLGQEIAQGSLEAGTNHTLNVSGLPSGIYIVSISNGDKSVSEKLVLR